MSKALLTEEEQTMPMRQLYLKYKHDDAKIKQIDKYMKSKKNYYLTYLWIGAKR